MDKRAAKKQAYAIAAEALRLATEGDMMDVAETEEDRDRLYDACEDLKLWLLNRSKD